MSTEPTDHADQIEAKPDTDAVPASAVFNADPPPAPKPTASVVEAKEPEPKEEPQAEPPKPGTPVDAKGVPFDASKHQVGKNGPRKRADGTWVPKGGRGRKNAAPQPAASADSYLAPESKAPTSEKPAGPAAAGDDDDDQDEDTAEALTPAEAEATAEGFTAATWGIAGATLGPEWEPTDTERAVWKNYWRRVAEATGIRFPLLIEGIIHAITSCARRLKNPDPDTRWGKCVAWLRGQDAA